MARTSRISRTCLLTRRFSEATCGSFKSARRQDWDHHENIRDNLPRLCVVDGSPHLLT